MLSRLIYPACSVCTGDPNSSQGIALKYGVLVLGGFILFILICIASTAFQWAKKSKEIEKAHTL